ncbi:hypothetical protein NQD34_018413 [Periophthalmus magnuspinnatus]|nr:hypothetical protein NQD34_018413 [Periophthalmus magnuspinnatus]
MGSKTSREYSPPGRPIVDFIRRKHEDKKSSEFGAFSLKNVHALENKLCEIEVEMREKITFLIKKLENIENYKECLKCGKTKLKSKSEKLCTSPSLFEDATEMCELKLLHS